MAKYKLGETDSRTNEPICIFNNETNTSIPLDNDNTDYQEYLEWVALGNTPEPADE